MLTMAMMVADEKYFEETFQMLPAPPFVSEARHANESANVTQGAKHLKIMLSLVNHLFDILKEPTSF